MRGIGMSAQIAGSLFYPALHPDVQWVSGEQRKLTSPSRLCSGNSPCPTEAPFHPVCKSVTFNIQDFSLESSGGIISGVTGLLEEVINAPIARADNALNQTFGKIF